MAQVVLGAVGAVVGGFFGVPQIGWAIGSAIGGALSQKDVHTEGPRLADLKVQASAYGGMKPVVYGAMRVSGNVIFCTDKREVPVTTEQGKGGPSASNTSYTYNVDIAIALCASEIAAVRKIWNNGQLIYDVSSGADLATVVSSTTKSAGFKLYPGNESQLPDPTIEATKGAGNVSAYRGTAYCVFTQLDCPGGQIPQLSFEVLAASTNATATILYANISDLPPENYQPVATPVGFYFGSRTGSPTFIAGPGYTAPIGMIGTSSFGGAPVQASPSEPPQYMGMEFSSGSYSSPLSVFVENIDENSGRNVIAVYVPGDSNNSFRPSRAAYDKVSKFYCGIDRLSSSVWANRIAIFSGDERPVTADTDWPNSDRAGLGFHDRIVYGQYVDASRRICLRTWDINGVFIADHIGPVITTNVTKSLLFGGIQVDERGVYLASYMTLSGGGQAVLHAHKFYSGEWTELVVHTDAAGDFAPFAGLIRGVQIYCTDTFLMMASQINQPAQQAFLLPFDGLSAVPYSLAQIITDVCLRSGLTPDKISTTAVVDTVEGYALTQVASARANLLPVQQYGFVDAVESDGLLKFRPRYSLVSVATIAYDELAVVEDGNDPGDAMHLQRAQEAGLPRSVSVNYMNVQADYQSGTEKSQRIISRSINDLVMDLPLATQPNRAARVSDVQLYDAWSARNQRRIKVSRKYAYLDAGDVITVEYPPGVYSAKRITTVSDSGTMLEMGLVDSDAETYSPTALGASPPESQAGIGFVPPTNFQLLDIPILRDADDNPGAYVALAGFAGNWPGAALYVGADDASLAVRGTVSGATVLGFAENALGSWAAGVLDDTNTLTVNVGTAGLLNSAPRDTVLDGDTNAFALGMPGRWEIAQFVRAVSLGSGRWMLSGLRRGLKGTETSIATHQAYDRFALLQPLGLLRPVFDVSELNQDRQYRAITTGQSINSRRSVAGLNSGQGLVPLSPIDLRGSRSSGNLTITWGRRTRLSNNWLAGVVPLGETSEAYEIEVWTAGFTALKRTLTATTATAVYTSAQQVADFGSAQASVSLRIYQMSSSIGRGKALQGTA